MTRPTPQPVSGPPIPHLRYFGTSWYDRDFRYWRLRAYMSAIAIVGLALILILVALAIVVIFSAASSWPIRSVLLALGALAIAWSCYSAYRTLKRAPEDRAQDKPFGFPKTSRAKKSRAGGAGMGLGTAASGGVGPAGGLLALGGLFVVGQAIGFVLVTFQRYLNEEEWQAAQAVKAWERANNTASRRP
ncbi:hypothetical protein GPX89_17135 [Nocardia sp. ET3-3]|uniref:Uncharacterized protein n=1 Tax=Nocardia terrae TaxID=2675851 RepID=A0A7K1UX56_9NOCA|nr:hypothetical protein [Nocardia terrae]MVU78964.1 hypothetical protein [Nocardia terrae]